MGDIQGPYSPHKSSWNVIGVFPGARGGQSELNSKPQNHEHFGCGATKIAGVFTSMELFKWQILKLQLYRRLKAEKDVDPLAFKVDFRHGLTARLATFTGAPELLAPSMFLGTNAQINEHSRAAVTTGGFPGGMIKIDNDPYHGARVRESGRRVETRPREVGGRWMGNAGSESHAQALSLVTRSRVEGSSLSVLGVERCRRGRRIMARRAGAGAARGGACPASACLGARRPCMRESCSPRNAQVGDGLRSLRRVPIQMRAEGDGSRSVPARRGSHTRAFKRRSAGGCAGWMSACVGGIGTGASVQGGHVPTKQSISDVGVQCRWAADTGAGVGRRTRMHEWERRGRDGLWPFPAVPRVDVLTHTIRVRASRALHSASEWGGHGAGSPHPCAMWKDKCARIRIDRRRGCAGWMFPCERSMDTGASVMGSCARLGLVYRGWRPAHCEWATGMDFWAVCTRRRGDLPPRCRRGVDGADDARGGGGCAECSILRMWVRPMTGDPRARESSRCARGSRTLREGNGNTTCRCLDLAREHMDQVLRRVGEVDGYAGSASHRAWYSVSAASSNAL
ncbi:hypothetical protein B0H13DRAFT_2284949 [Mycena leptocephala]|nr:hypothetical protein B0H13DRAFT_2284949 [Mycena leptocephala]